MGAKANRILVVDDEASVCEAIAALLRDDGHEVVEAYGGPEALALMDAGHFDLVFTDFKMAGMTGAELAQSIHQKFGLKPIILVTAFPPQSLPPEISAVVVKPFSWESLRDAMTEVTSSSASTPNRMNPRESGPQENHDR
jgi:CheY-like chemotaxis protein